MKKTILALTCFTAGLALAQDGDETKVTDDENVDLYISVIENIDVTAEKPPLATADEPNEEIDAILDEAEALDEVAE